MQTVASKRIGLLGIQQACFFSLLREFEGYPEGLITASMVRTALAVTDTMSDCSFAKVQSTPTANPSY
jgi:hypothetical protein